MTWHEAAQLTERGRAIPGPLYFLLPRVAVHVPVQRLEVVHDPGARARVQVRERAEHRDQVDGEVEGPDLRRGVKFQVLVEAVLHQPCVTYPHPGLAHGNAQIPDPLPQLRLTAQEVFDGRLVVQQGPERSQGQIDERRYRLVVDVIRHQADWAFGELGHLIMIGRKNCAYLPGSPWLSRYAGARCPYTGSGGLFACGSGRALASPSS